MTARVRDASDRLSPILVKELRQGVRGHVFTGAFLLQQLLLLCAASLSILLDVNPGNREILTFLFWTCVTLPLVIILPLGAAVSISGELAANTFEPLLLTRLTPWRLVAGKWAAIASQAIVLAVAALPFVLVRYYLGAIEIVRDLAFLAAYVGCALLLASVAIAISPARLSALFRWVLLGVLALVLGGSFLSTLGQAAFARAYAYGPAWVDVLPSTLSFLGIVLIGVASALEAGALQIAPAATARPLRLRVLALVALGAAAWMAPLPTNPFRLMAIAWSVALGSIVTVAALCEPAPPLRSRYAAFFRRRLFVPFGWFLAPGWPAAVGFLFLVAVPTAAAAAVVHGPTAGLFVLAGLLGSLLLPLVIWRTFFPRARGVLMLLLVSLVSAGFSTVAPIAMNIESPALWTVGWLVLPLCPSAYALGRLGWSGDYGAAPAITLPPAADVIFVVFVSAVVIAALWHTVGAWRQIGRLVRERPAA